MKLAFSLRGYFAELTVYDRGLVVMMSAVKKGPELRPEAGV